MMEFVVGPLDDCQLVVHLSCYGSSNVMRDFRLTMVMHVGAVV